MISLEHCFAYVESSHSKGNTKRTRPTNYYWNKVVSILLQKLLEGNYRTE